MPCWQVLSNVAHAAKLPYLTPRYLQAAVEHNQRAEMLKAEAGRGTCPAPSSVPGCGDTAATIQVAPPPRLDPVSVPNPSCVSDKRTALLEQHGLDTAILTDDMTLAYIEAWVDYVTREAERIHDPAAYLSATLPRGKWPRQDTGDRARRPRVGLTKGQGMVAELPAASIPSYARSAASTQTDEQRLWPDVLAKLKGLVEPSEFDTWLQETSLVAIDDGVVIVSAPNVFAREMLDRQYTEAIGAVLAEVIGVPVQVQFVIG